MNGLARAAVLAGLAILISAPAPAQVIPEWARERTNAWYRAFNTSDAKMLAAMHTPDAVLLLGDMTMEGRAAIERFHAEQFERVRFECEWSIQGVSIVGRLSAVWGTDVCVATPKSGASAVKRNGRFMTMYQMQADGTWMIIRDTGE